MITFKLASDSVRSACISNKWYTHGDTEAYAQMLKYVTNYCNCMTEFEAQEKIEYVADDIYKHSNVRLMADMAGVAPIEVRYNMELVLLNACTLSIAD